jgi:hypothetical protein
MPSKWYLGGGPRQRCSAWLSGGRGRCRAWALKGKRCRKRHGGMSTGPRTPVGMARTVEAVRWGRFRKIEYLHAGGRKAPGGRPGRISYRLRRAVIEEAETELAGLDPEAIRTAVPSIDEMSEAERLADLEQYGLVLLLDELKLSHRPPPAQVFPERGSSRPGSARKSVTTIPARPWVRYGSVVPCGVGAQRHHPSRSLRPIPPRSELSGPRWVRNPKPWPDYRTLDIVIS